MIGGNPTLRSPLELPGISQAFDRDDASGNVVWATSALAAWASPFRVKIWAREIQALGHFVELIPPHLVRPYVTRNKTDRSEAKGILEAGRNTEIRLVPVKTLSQRVIGSIHRFRSGWIGARTAQVTMIAGKNAWEDTRLYP